MPPAGKPALPYGWRLQKTIGPFWPSIPHWLVSVDARAAVVPGAGRQNRIKPTTDISGAGTQ